MTKYYRYLRKRQGREFCGHERGLGYGLNNIYLCFSWSTITCERLKPLLIFSSLIFSFSMELLMARMAPVLTSFLATSLASLASAGRLRMFFSGSCFGLVTSCSCFFLRRNLAYLAYKKQCKYNTGSQKVKRSRFFLNCE